MTVRSSASTPRVTTAALTRTAATTSPPVTAPAAPLKKGDSGPKVKQLQDALVKLGYLTKEAAASGPGTYGVKTEAAVKKFQTDKKLSVDGAYGAKTQAALAKALSGTTPTTPPTKFTKPAVISAPSPNYDERNGTAIDAIILHHTASNDGKADLSWLRNPQSKVSANYMIDRDGKVYQLVSDEKRAWHAGVSELRGVPTDMNARSIGIEIVNDGSGKTAFTEAQYKSITQLVGYLKQEYKVPMENILGHKDVAVPKGRKDDPASNFDWKRVRSGITKPS
ncbi:N-acetylmuramoyl-L-alanine amidase [Corallococcus sp. H22C18031201]|nr:N-acetylmuramoyl-L-alanine amidase [Corallococcus sp. H22C18031201]